MQKESLRHLMGNTEYATAFHRAMQRARQPAGAHVDYFRQRAAGPHPGL